MCFYPRRPNEEVLLLENQSSQWLMGSRWKFLECHRHRIKISRSAHGRMGCSRRFYWREVTFLRPPAPLALKLERGAAGVPAGPEGRPVSLGLSHGAGLQFSIQARLLVHVGAGEPGPGKSQDPAPWSFSFRS